MESTSNPIADRDLFYYRARQRNRIFEELVGFFAARAERDGLTKRDIAQRLKRDPAQITRWLSQPSNVTLDTLSDLLLAMDAEIDCSVMAFGDYATPNDIHSWASDYWSASPAMKFGAGPAMTSQTRADRTANSSGSAKPSVKFERAEL